VGTVSEKRIQSFKVKSASGNVYLIERLDAERPRPAYRVASNHMVVDYNPRDDTFRILGSGEVLRRV
jgi:hypothetical protein